LAGLGLYKLWQRCVAAGPLAAALFVLVAGLLDASRTPLYQKLGWEDLQAEHFWPASFERIRAFAIGRHSREALDAKLYNAADYSLDDNRIVGRELAREAPVSDTIYVWGFEPGVYWFAGRKPATRFLTNTPQRSPWQLEPTRRELIAELTDHWPHTIVVQHRDVMKQVTGDELDSKAALATFPELSELLASRYQFQRTLRDFDLYQRR
jgi:hypothetical protein